MAFVRSLQTAEVAGQAIAVVASIEENQSGNVHGFMVHEIKIEVGSRLVLFVRSP